MADSDSWIIIFWPFLHAHERVFMDIFYIKTALEAYFSTSNDKTALVVYFQTGKWHWWPIFVPMRRVTSENKQSAMLNVAYGGGTLMVAITETISGATYWAQLATVHWSQSLTGPWQFGGIVWRLADHNGNMSPVTDGGWGLKYFVCLCSVAQTQNGNAVFYKDLL